jgi:hypothetical protein
MNKIRKIPIHNQVDIHAARMYTREAARLVGLELNEQAQVSMATSSMAECLKMGLPVQTPSGQPIAANQIIIQVIENGYQGLQVDFESLNISNFDSIQVQLKRIQSLVDEIKTEHLPDGPARVVMIKWGRHIGANSRPDTGTM